MKLVTFERNPGIAEAGVLIDEIVVALTGAGINAVLEIAAGGASALEKVSAYVASAPQTAKTSLASVKLHAPIPKPGKIFCIGLNYRDHAIESNMAIPAVPTIFSKFNNTVIATGDQIVLPRVSTQPDYEAEFALVIGKGGKRIAAEDWKAHVFGYMNLNDVSARDLQLVTTQWLMGKTPDTFAPMGPYLLTADEVADPHNLNIDENQRRGTAEFEHQAPDFPHPGVDRLHFASGDARARRHHFHRHALRSWVCSQAATLPCRRRYVRGGSGRPRQARQSGGCRRLTDRARTASWRR